MLWPWATSARPAIPSTVVSSTQTTPSLDPGSRPKARPRPSGVVPATTPSGARPRPARRTLVPKLATGAHHPAAEPRAAEAPPGEAAAHRRAEQHHRLRLDLGVPVQHLEHQDTAEAVPDEEGLALRKARQGFDVGVEGRAAAVVEDVDAVAALRKPRGEHAHRHARHPQPGREDQLIHALFPSRAKMALARTIGRPPATR